MLQFIFSLNLDLEKKKYAGVELNISLLEEQILKKIKTKEWKNSVRVSC